MRRRLDPDVAALIIGVVVTVVFLAALTHWLNL